MNIEYEVTVLEINKEKLEKELVDMGAVKLGDYFQRRYTYDLINGDDNKWLRLRTNGKKSTLTIKSVFDKNSIGGTHELEIEVDDFDKTYELLKELSYNHRNYQENRRTSYKLGDVQFDIDEWPMIPCYVEIEGNSENDVKDMLKKLDINMDNVTTYDVTSIYNEIYDIDILKIKELKF